MDEFATKGPLFFSEFENQVQELFVDGFIGEATMFTFLTCPASGLTFSFDASKSGRSKDTHAIAHYKCRDSHTISAMYSQSSSMALGEFKAVHVDLDSKFLPSAKARASIEIPHYCNSTLSLWYLHRHAALNMVTALNTFPAIRLATTIGTPSIGLGIALGITSKSYYEDCDAGIHVTKPRFNASISLNNKGDMMRATYVHHLDEAKKISVGLAICRFRSACENSFVVGGSWCVNDITTVKARLDNAGRLKTCLRHFIDNNSCLTMSGEFDIKNLNRTPKFGLAVALER